MGKALVVYWEIRAEELGSVQKQNFVRWGSRIRSFLALSWKRDTHRPAMGASLSFGVIVSSFESM